MGRLFLLDTDFVLKLAALDLFPEFLDVYQIQKSSLRVIRREVEQIVKYKGARIFSHFGKKKIDEVTKYISALPHIAEEVLSAGIFGKQSTDLHAQLNGYDRINSGEITLLINAHLINKRGGESLIYTADRNCVQELARNPEIITGIIPDVAKKILILEQVLVRIITEYEFEDVIDRLSTGKHCDKYLADVFAKGRGSHENEVIHKLNNRINDIHRENQNILYLDGDSAE